MPPCKRKTAGAVSEMARSQKRAKPIHDAESGLDSSEEEFVEESRITKKKKNTSAQKNKRSKKKTKTEIVNSRKINTRHRSSPVDADIVHNGPDSEELSIVKKHKLPPTAKGRTSSQRCRSKGIKENDSGMFEMSAPNIELQEEKHNNSFNNSEKALKENIADVEFSPEGDHHLSGKANQSSSESEWEEVQDGNVETDEEDREPVIPKEGVQITLDLPESQTKRNKKKFDIAVYFRRVANRLRKELREGIHKVHLLCLLASGFWIEGILAQDIVRAIALSIVPLDLVARKQRQTKKESLTKLLDWYHQEFKLVVKEGMTAGDIPTNVYSVIQGFQERHTSSKTVYVCMLLICIRTAGYDARFVWSFQPSPYKPSSDEVKSSGKRKLDNVKNETTNASSQSAVGTSSQGRSTKKKGAECRPSNDKHSTMKESLNDIADDKSICDKAKGRRQRRSMRHSGQKVDYREEESEDSDHEVNKQQNSEKKKIKLHSEKNFKGEPVNLDDDFEIVVAKVRKPGPLTGLKKNRKALSSEDEFDLRKSANGNDQWIEVYAPWSKCWICINCIGNCVSNPRDMEAGATKPLLYVVAFEGVGHVKDVTRRYASGWLTHTRKLRVSAPWWDETLEPFHLLPTKREKLEDDQLQDELLERPKPKTISEYKNHPLYALKRHLLKFECIYPPEAVPMGYIRGEPVYSRECVRTLHSRETWLKQARTVKIGETPYKVVKARPKWIPATREIKTDIPLEIFGEWQTEEYAPPVAQDGKVPRNGYGNVDLFQPSMLPIGTVHLQVPGLQRIAKKLNIDCAQAMIGWDIRGWGSVPMYIKDGMVLIKTQKHEMMLQWNVTDSFRAKPISL